MFGLKRRAIDKPEGFIYIASNQGMPGIIKIGMSYKSPAKRLAELYTTGVPYPFVLEYQCRVPDRRVAERYLHDIFSEKRVTNNREFFAVSANNAAKITRNRVANKRLSYEKPTDKLKRFIVVCTMIAVGAAILYNTWSNTETAAIMFPQIRDFLEKIVTP